MGGTRIGNFLMDVVAAANAVGSQPTALITLAMGFGMLVVCKKMGIDTTIAGGVIGVASNMLQSQIKQELKAQHVDTVNQSSGGNTTLGK